MTNIALLFSLSRERSAIASAFAVIVVPSCSPQGGMAGR
jgi:hypothetical protein